MFEGSIVLGITILLFAAWLHMSDASGWPRHTDRTELDRQYLSRRTRSRKWIHGVIAACGVLILVAAFAGPGIVWMGAWILVMIGLLIVVVMALLDALRTHRYHVAKLPELRREILGDEDSSKET